MQLDALGAADLPVTVGRYTLTAVLGEGGMARVFRATMDGAMGFKKPAAVKVVLRASGPKSELLRAQLVQEARLGGMLNHPNVVQTFDCGELGGFPFIAMELVEGLGLSELIEQVGPLPPAAVLDVAIQTARGLHHAHTATHEGEPLHIIHRDVKPSNILVRRDGVVKVMDFGIAKVSMNDALATESGMTKGTPSYMSPEQLAGKGLDARSDLFSLGAVIFHMMTGRTLFTGTSINEVMMRIIQVDEWIREQSVENTGDQCVPGLGPILVSLMQRSVSDRPFDAKTLADKLDRLRHQLPPDALLPRIMSQVMPPITPSRTPPSRSDTLALGDTAMAPPPRGHASSSGASPGPGGASGDVIQATRAMPSSRAGKVPPAPGLMDASPQRVGAEDSPLSTQTRQGLAAGTGRKKRRPTGPSGLLVLGTGAVIGVLVVLLALAVKSGNPPAATPSKEVVAPTVASTSAPLDLGGTVPAPTTTPTPSVIPTSTRTPIDTKTPSRPASPPKVIEIADPPKVVAVVVPEKVTPPPEPRPTLIPAAASAPIELGHSPVSRAMAGTTKSVAVTVTGPDEVRVTLHYGPEGGAMEVAACVSVGNGVWRGTMAIPAGGALTYWIEASASGSKTVSSGSAASPHRVTVF